MGREQAGPRFAVVVQSDDLFVSTLIVVPTSTSARAAIHRPEVVVDGRRTRVLAEQVMAVDTGRLGEVVGHLSWDELQSVDEALRLVLAVD
jgi:mRNA interferase MazF